MRVTFSASERAASCCVDNSDETELTRERRRITRHDERIVRRAFVRLLQNGLQCDGRLQVGQSQHSVRYLAWDLGRQSKVRVNAISAGPMRTLARRASATSTSCGTTP